MRLARKKGNKVILFQVNSIAYKKCCNLRQIPTTLCRNSIYTLYERVLIYT
jgi:hypothetical protein